MTDGLVAADRVAIIDAVARLTHGVDALDAELLAQALTADGVVRIAGAPGVEARGADAVLGFFASALPQGGQARRHVRNTIIDATSADEARARSYYLLTLVANGGPPTVVATGIYDDLLVGDEAPGDSRRWRVLARTIVPDNTSASSPIA